MSDPIVTAYPLVWPFGRPRTPQYMRPRSAFKVTFGAAVSCLRDEISRLGGRNLIISTNTPLRRDGLPSASASRPSDSGVAIYFTRKERKFCFACDKYQWVEENLRAVQLTIEALRGIARWGTGDMMEAAFTGFIALPSAVVTPPDWRQVLRCPDAIHFPDVEAAYLRRRKEAHPDHGGSSEAFNAVQAAWEQAQREFCA